MLIQNFSHVKTEVYTYWAAGLHMLNIGGQVDDVLDRWMMNQFGQGVDTGRFD